MAAAPLPTRIIDKSLVSDRVIIDTMVNKYCDHCPLYRQSVASNARRGIEISRATMCGWVMTRRRDVDPGGRRHAQGVTGRQLHPGRRNPGRCADARRQRHKSSRLSLAVRNAGRSDGLRFPHEPRARRAGSTSWATSKEFSKPTHTPLTIAAWAVRTWCTPACWSHARRHFVDAVKLNKQDAASIRAVELMDKLFAIDAQARDENMDHAARHALRQEKAPPLLDEIRSHILAMSKTVLPKSAAGQACSYTLAIWKRLTRFLDYPELELSNNLAENSMRPMALGRSNWIHIGSEQAGPRVAAIFSVIESCRRLKIPVRDYLADILARPCKRDSSAHRRSYPCRLGRKTSTDDPACVRLTLTIQRQ